MLFLTLYQRMKCIVLIGGDLTMTPHALFPNELHPCMWYSYIYFPIQQLSVIGQCTNKFIDIETKERTYLVNNCIHNSFHKNTKK